LFGKFPKDGPEFGKLVGIISFKNKSVINIYARNITYVRNGQGSAGTHILHISGFLEDGEITLAYKGHSFPVFSCNTPETRR
jgi:hypothetical protein